MESEQRHASSRSPVLELLTDELVAEVFSWLGPIGTVQCSLTCQAWRNISYNSRALWRHFAHVTYGFSIPECEENHHHLQQSSQVVDWRAVYAYLSTKALEPAVLIPATVVFADDGTPIPGYPPENAIRDVRAAWCTNGGVDQNVDLVLKCRRRSEDTNNENDESPLGTVAATAPMPYLISGFAARNAGIHFTAPLKEALVFVSNENPIDLEAGRYYNDENIAKEWITKLGGPRPPSTSNDEASAARDARAAASLENASIEVALFQQWIYTNTAPSDFYTSKTSLYPVCFEHSKTLARSSKEPVVAFSFPPLPAAYHARIERRCAPTVARWIHFKLLSSYSTPHRLADNIDVMDLHSFGVALPELESLLRPPASATGLQHPDPSSWPMTDPSYKRMHKERVYTARLVNPDNVMIT